MVWVERKGFPSLHSERGVGTWLFFLVWVISVVFGGKGGGGFSASFAHVCA